MINLDPSDKFLRINILVVLSNILGVSLGIGRIEHNLLSVLDISMSIEESLSMIYGRIKLLIKDPYIKLVLDYLSNECWIHRKLLEDLLVLDMEYYKIRREELRDVIDHISERFRSVRELYTKTLNIYDEKELLSIVNDLERVSRDLVNTYSTLRTFRREEVYLARVLDLLISDSEKHTEILRELRSYLGENIDTSL